MRRLIIIIVIALALSFFLNIGGVLEDQRKPGDPLPAPKSQATLLAILSLSGGDEQVGLSHQYGISRGMVQPQNDTIALHFADSRGDPEIAKGIIEEYLAQGEIHGLIVSGREVCQAIAPYAEEYRIPMAAITAPADEQRGGAGRYLISFTPSSEEEVRTLAPFLSEYTDIAVLYPDTEEGRQKATLIRNISAGNVRMVEYNQTADDFTELIRPLRAMPPEIFIIGGNKRVDALITEIRSRGANPVILLSEEASINLRREAPHLAFGVFVLTPSIAHSHPLFSEKRMTADTFPTSYAAEAFDAAYTLSTRISSCNGDANCVAGWYWMREYDGALGHVSFNEERRASYEYTIIQIREGETEVVSSITAPPNTVYILIDSDSSEDWFKNEVKRGVETALSVINAKTTISLPLAMQSGIPALFDADLAALYDSTPPNGATVIGRVSITPDGRTVLSTGRTEPEIAVGIDNEAYINGCFTILETIGRSGDEKSISLLSRDGGGESFETLRRRANSSGYVIAADLTYLDLNGIRDAISTIRMSNPHAPLFVSATTPEEAILIIMQGAEAGYAPDAYFTLGDAWKADSFIRNVQLISEGIITGTVFRKEHISESQTIRDLNSLMVRRTGREMNDISARAFTGVMMIADAAERGGRGDPATVSTALQNSQMTTEYGALYDGTTYIAQMRGGVYRTIQ